MREPREVLEVKESRLAVSESCHTTEIAVSGKQECTATFPSHLFGQQKGEHRHNFQKRKFVRHIYGSCTYYYYIIVRACGMTWGAVEQCREVNEKGGCANTSSHYKISPHTSS